MFTLCMADGRQIAQNGLSFFQTTLKYIMNVLLSRVFDSPSPLRPVGRGLAVWSTLR